MEKEKILSELTAKLGKTSLSERSIATYVDNIHPTITDDAQVTDSFYETHVNILKSISGNMDKEIADKVNDFKKNYKPQSTEGGEGGNGGGAVGENDKRITELTEKVTTLQKQLEEGAKAQKQADILKAVQAKMQEQGATDNGVLAYTFKGEVVDVEKDVDTLVGEYLKVYDSNYTMLRGEGAKPRGGNSSTGEQSAKALDNFFSQKMAQGKFPKTN